MTNIGEFQKSNTRTKSVSTVHTNSYAEKMFFFQLLTKNCNVRRLMSSRSELRSAGQREEKHALQTLYLEAIASTRDGKEPEPGKFEPNQNPGFARTEPNRNSKVTRSSADADNGLDAFVGQ